MLEADQPTIHNSNGQLDQTAGRVGVPMTESVNPVVIKKYGNRRLYNTATSAYENIESLAGMAKCGDNFVVYDAKSGDDITRSVLQHIIAEEEKKSGQDLLPITFMRRLIGFYDDAMQEMVPAYLELSMQTLTREREKRQG